MIGISRNAGQIKVPFDLLRSHSMESNNIALSLHGFTNNFRKMSTSEPIQNKNCSRQYQYPEKWVLVSHIGKRAGLFII